MTPAQSVLRWLPAGVLLVAALAAFAALALNVSGNARVSADEAANLIRSLWYASGAVRPYTAADAAPGMPLYPYLIGLWQTVFGADPSAARQLSIALAIADAALLFTICRRLTANTTVAAAAVFIFLVTPAAAYFHATASPVAVMTLFHLLAVLLIVQSLGRPRIWASAAVAVCLAAMVATDRSALANVVFLGPLYVLAVGRQRFLQAAVLVVVFAAAVAGCYAAFGVGALDVLRWGPLLAPVWQLAGLAPRALAQLDANTVQGAGAVLALPRDAATMLIDSLVLPFGAAIAGAVALCLVTGRGLRVLWAVPIYLLWLVGARILGLGSTGGTALIERGAADLPIAALGCALTLAMIWRLARDTGLTGSVVVIGGALLIAAANTFAPALATRPDRQFFPAPMLRYPGPGTERTDLRKLEDFIAKSAPAGEPLLILHQAPVVPLAATLAGRRVPPQSIVPVSTSFRALKAGLAPGVREATLAAIEAQGFWTDETMARWIERDYDAVLIQDGVAFAGRDAAEATLATAFDAAGDVTIAGQRLVLYKRKP